MRGAAFTLAEVLITLEIIGVVAAMTLPTVINNIQNRQLETGLKKAYSTINQALDLYYTENGERFVPTETSHTLKPILMKYIKNIKDCGYGTGAGYVCSAKSKKYFTEVYKTFNNYTMWNNWLYDDGAFIISDGMLIFLEDASKRIYISVDINGFNKKPNKLGQDLFTFQLNNNGKLIPMGTDGTDYTDNTLYCSKTSTNMLNGISCTAKALSEKDFFKNLP